MGRDVLITVGAGAGAGRRSSGEVTNQNEARQADRSTAVYMSAAERVFNAAYSGKVADLEAALEEDPRAVNVIGAGIEGWTALKAALVNGHPGIVPILLRRGADPNLRDSKWGATPLYELLTNCHRPHMRPRALEVAKLLLDAGADPNAAPMKGDEGVVRGMPKRTHIQVALKAGLLDVVALLTEAAARASQAKEVAEPPPMARPEEAKEEAAPEAAAPKRKASRQAKPAAAAAEADAAADEGAQKRRRNPPRDRSKR